MRRNLCRLALFAFLITSSCDQGYAVEKCEPGQGIQLDNSSVPLLGPVEAPVDLTIFGDFQCPNTKSLWLELSAFIETLEQDGKLQELKIHFRHFPLDFHNRAYAASVAAAAAHEQGDDAFWALFPHLLTTGAMLTDEDILSYAQLSGLDMVQFEQDLQNEAVEMVVQRDIELAMEMKLQGTPSTILCGVRVSLLPSDLIKNLEHLIY